MTNRIGAFRQRQFHDTALTARGKRGATSHLARALAVSILLYFPLVDAFAQSAGLVAAYSFDEGTGATLLDRSGNTNNGTLVNGTAWSSIAKFGMAASFDGTNDRIDIPDNSTLDLTSRMTLEAWVRPTATGSYRTVILKEIPAELAYSLYSADSDHGGRPSGWVRINQFSYSADAAAAVPLNTYSHLAVTFNGTVLAFYVNGALIRSTNITGSAQTSSLPLRIGGNAIWGEYFQGQIDEVRVYNRALTQSEIQADMATPISGAGQPDTSAPTVSVTTPAAGATVSGTITVDASASDNVGVAGVQFLVDGAASGAEDTAAPYAQTWNAAGVSPGSHTLTARARDAAGNSTTSAPVVVTVSNADTEAPTATISSPPNGANVSGSTTIAATVADNVGVVGVQFLVDDAVVGAEDTGAPYSVPWDASGATAGTHQIEAVARDAAGHTTTSAPITVTVTVSQGDTQAPTVAITSPASGANVTGYQNVTVSAADNVGVVGVQFKVDGVNFGWEDGMPPYSRFWNSATAGNGSHQLTAVARDAAGNSTTAAAVSVTVGNGDAVAPTVSITSPSSGATVSGSVSVAASAADSVGVVGIQFRVDGVNFGTEDTTAPYSRTWSSTTASSGSHQLTAIARDAAGNSATAASVSVTVSNGDAVAPTISMTSPSDGATVSGSTTLSASASDNVGVVGVRFTVDGSTVGVEDTTAPYSISWNTATVAAGTHSVAAVVRDQAGNATTSTARTVTVNNNSDTVSPTVTFSGPSNGATVSNTVTVSAVASDNVGVVGVQFRLDGGNLGSEDLSSPYSMSWNTLASSNGSHQLTAVARDAAGRTGSASITVNVSNAGGTSLTLDGNQRFQLIDGFGVSANSASWNNGELRPAIDMLVDQGGSTIWRVIIEMADWEATNDDSNPNTFNWTYYNSIYSSPAFEELWSTLSYLNSKGITSTLMLNFMGRGPGWMGGPDLPTAMEDEWVETVASVAYYAIKSRNIQFGLFAPNNESDWDGIEGIRMDRWQYARVMRKLAQRLDAIGLSSLRLVGPDTAAIGSGVNEYMPTLMAEPLVMAKLDHFAFHNYAGDSGGASTAIRSSGYPSKNFWITEVSNVWDAMTHMSQGPAAILVWDGYDSVYNHAILAGRGTSPPNDVGNGPPLLAYSTSSHLYTPRKPFYEFAQLFRFVPGGSERVAAAESSSNVTVYAFHHTVSGRVTLVGRNSGGSNVTFAGALSNLPTVPSFEFYRTSSSMNMQRGTDVPVTNGAFSFVAPGSSVFTLTYAGVPDSIPPSVSITNPTAGASVSGTIAVSSATAVDNIGIRGVQFRVDGALLGVEDTTAPYSVAWDTTAASNGSHQLTAVARDFSGNVTTSDPQTVMVINSQ